jgi:hypothetical protein
MHFSSRLDIAVDLPVMLEEPNIKGVYSLRMCAGSVKQEVRTLVEPSGLFLDHGRCLDCFSFEGLKALARLEPC